MMGNGHLGVVLLPKTEDSYEQPQLNFYPGIKKPGSTANSEHRQIDMLVFGGSRFKDREPNENELTDICLMLSIPAGKHQTTYSIKYMPGAKLRCPDKFFNNMQTQCDLN